MSDKIAMANSKDKKSMPDHEHSMARSELSAIENGVKRLKKKMKGEGNIEAWVQSKITRAADYIGSAADYVDSGEHNVKESVSKVRKGILKGKEFQISRSTGAGALSPEAADELGPKAKELRQKKLAQTSLPRFIKNDVSLTDKILEEILQEGKKKKGLWANIHAKRKRGERPARPGEKDYPETLDIEEGLKQARKNVGASKCWDNKKVNPNKPTKIKDGTEVPNCIPESVRMPAKTGNIIMATLTWKGKYYCIKMFFPSVKLPKKKDVEFEIQKIYPGSKLYNFQVTDHNVGETLVQVSEEEKKKLNDPVRTPGENKKFKVHVKDPKTGNIITVRFGDPNMEIKRDDPDRLKAFRSRHNCDGPEAKDKTTAKYWSCYQWRRGHKVDN